MADLSMTTMTSHPINITVKTSYLEEYSQPEQQRYVFAYTVTIENNSDQAAKLLNRHWIITDANNIVQEVQGVGVVGQQPYIPPGETYSYSSNAILETQTGTMEGSYEMQNDKGEHYKVPIPLFSLICPRALH